MTEEYGRRGHAAPTANELGKGQEEEEYERDGCERRIEEDMHVFYIPRSNIIRGNKK
jgi:hypothetical protein